MIDITRFALNRIVCPALGLEEFFRLAADLGLSKVELRNDLPGGRITDGMAPADAAALAQKCGVQVATINALQKFNLASLKDSATRALEDLLETAAALHCPAIVLVPNNDTKDARDERTRRAETVAALSAFAPLFTRRGITGLVEPLGFAECSVRSLVTAREEIASSGASCYRTVYDTFHHYLGPDKDADAAMASGLGLVHVSGVEFALPKEKIRDAHRVLPGPADRMGSREQIARLEKLGYRGVISYEPFAPEVQRMPLPALTAALRASIDYLRAIP